MILLKVLKCKRYCQGFDFDTFLEGDYIEPIHEVGIGFEARRYKSPKSPMIFVPYSEENKSYKVIQTTP